MEEEMEGFFLEFATLANHRQKPYHHSDINELVVGERWSCKIT